MSRYSLLKHVCALVSACLALGACARAERSPFALWDFRAGMPLAALDSIALHDQKERMVCTHSYGSFRTCALRSLGAFGVVSAVVDSSGKAVLISYKPDVNAMFGFGDMIAGLTIEARRTRAKWNRVAEPYPDKTVDPPARAETWTSADKHWSARLVWRKDGYPAEFRVADERAIGAWTLLAERAAADSLARLAVAPVESVPVHSDPEQLLELVSFELKRIVDAQLVYHDMHRDYADDLKALVFSPRAKVVITIGGADPFGFWARGTHSEVPGRACLVWLGTPPRAPAQLGKTEGEPVCAE